MSPLPACIEHNTVDQVLTVGLRLHGQSLGGLGVISYTQERWSLLLLAPGGLELFTVAGPPAVATTGLAAWQPWLDRLPVERDLHLYQIELPERACQTADGRLSARGDRWRWRGAGGRAWISRDAGWNLKDSRRSYTLTFVVADAP